jgi:hypothetical protein
MCRRVIGLRRGRLGARAVDRSNYYGYRNQLDCDDCAHASFFHTSGSRRDALLEQAPPDSLRRVRSATRCFVSRRYFREILASAHEAIGDVCALARRTLKN